jgi:hypothetical protein
MNVGTPKSFDDALLNVLLTLLTAPSTLLHAPLKVLENP